MNKRRISESGLSLFFGAIFALALLAQAVSGLAAYNNDQLDAGGDAVTKPVGAPHDATAQEG